MCYLDIVVVTLKKYSSPPLTRTPKENEKLLELVGVRVGVRFRASSIPTKVH